MRPAPYVPPLAVAVIDPNILGGALVVMLNKCVYVSTNGKTWRGCTKPIAALQGLSEATLKGITTAIKTAPFRLVITTEMKEFLDFAKAKTSTPEIPCASSSSPS